MTEIRELINAVEASGATIDVEGTDLVIRAASKVSSDIKTRLRANKPDVVVFLMLRTVTVDSDEIDIEDSWEWIQERAAILEFEAGLTRDVANTRAFELWFRRFVSSTIG